MAVTYALRELANAVFSNWATLCHHGSGAVPRTWECRRKPERCDRRTNNQRWELR